MTTPISLKEAERRVFRAAYDDGLWDILIACFAAQFAFGPFLSVPLGDFWASAVFLPFWGLAYFAIWVIRKRVVLPRIGQVKFGPTRRAKLWNFTLIMLALNCLSLIGGIAAWLSFGVVPGWVITAVFALIVLNGFAIAAYFLDLPRLYAYGVLAFLSFFVGQLLYLYAHVPHHGLPITFGFTALVILLTGATRFIWFLRDNPPIPADMSSWEPE